MKQTSTFICQQCGYQSASFLGKCPECGEWNSLVETLVGDRPAVTLGQQNLNIDLFKLSDVKSQAIKRISTGFSEFDRVLGGGVVPGSIVLISGDPGIGKSTLLLQCAMQIAKGQLGNLAVRSVGKKTSKSSSSLSGSTELTAEVLRAEGPNAQNPNNPEHVVLYVTGEESSQQVKIRADRLGTVLGDLYILPETGVETIIAAAQKLSPTLLIIDSIQTVVSQKLSGSAGSVGQLRECSQILQRFAKGAKTGVFIVGHVTKEGSIAGPKVLEHLVDAVLNLEGDDMHAFRLLRSSKNRFGSTFEVGVFEMQDKGLIQVDNPSQIFLEQRISARAGSVVTSTLAGGRPILAEIQALCASTIFPVPTRRVGGLDFSRMQIVIASLSKVSKLALGNLDIYLNVAGGLKIVEPAADLPAALAVVSAAVDKSVKEGICAFGEVGLLGELRPVANLKVRVEEAKRLGFNDFVSPDRFKTLEEATSYAIHGE
ncbi:hypothetical protein A3B51_00860 [Candidatus Curtissbacteria bacterium RIFCSPLOWO2_01_FULL_41_18]|uniref:DNA repair protein RadA n=1 Tax=Candidatus Curtissbacteria bacterium RIFCSPLOWO2_01_FULL_41_18 TaxID=1797727 RepID=A0A1F5HHT3_9BACT|nr:MAG: hypothetical protein A3B51_00860 [Candidatus Curtissbacteria bacterium RIFCSPLOWO2_01_FULL_41_18]